MRHRARDVATRAVPAVALALAAGAAVAGCASATATTTAAATPAASTRAAAPMFGPAAPDPACVPAKQAERTLQSRQGKDQYNESTLDKDFTSFATALSSAAAHAKSAATAQAMNDLADDYTALVESQSGGAQLPKVSQVQKDGAAFDKACA
jgi:hypothetical protein